jgi:hypothetical protein
VANPGVSDALAAALGVIAVRPLGGGVQDPLDKIVTFVPHADTGRVVDSLAAAGAGQIGDYSRCAWMSEGTGTFLPGDGATPVIGRAGRVEVVPETRVEMVLPRSRRSAVLAALRATHPYEEPAYDVLMLAPLPGPRGLGRVGELSDPMTLREFTAAAAAALPRTAWGVRAAGDPARPVRRVAVCGGAGADLAGEAAAADADVLLTADLRHHPVLDAVTEWDLAFIDAAHWATEWPWLPAAARQLTSDLADTVTATVSTILTDPWTVSERP